MFKVTARDQGHYKGHSGAFVTYCNISCSAYSFMGGGRVVRRCWVNFQCWGVLLLWNIRGQGPIVLAVGAGGGGLDIFPLIFHFSFLSPSLWEGVVGWCDGAG